MKLDSGIAIYVLWLRETKRFLRAKSRVVGMLGMPLFFLVFMGLGFTNMPVPGMPESIDYIHFLVPGIIGMTLLFTSSFAGLSVLWDKEFGFLKEIMVAPVSRVAIVMGRTVGSATTALIQGVLVLIISFIMGFRPSGLPSVLLSVVFMALIATTFIGMGLIFSSNMEDMHGFSLIMNFIIFPIFFLSGAMFPVQNLPEWIRCASYINPLTYGVDGLRGTLVGASMFPVIFDFVILIGFSATMVALGAYFFERSEAV